MRKPKLRELKEAVRALIKGPYTSKFPKEPVKVPEHFRGTPTYVEEDCVGCGACGQVCPTGAITVTDQYSEEKGRMVRHIERNWGQCIFCSNCYVNCITGKGIMLDEDFEKSTTDRADFIDAIEKDLVLCEICGEPITSRDHIEWMIERLSELAFANQTFMVERMGKLKLADEITPRTDRELERSDYMRTLCPNCRASYILSDEWGES